MTETSSQPVRYATTLVAGAIQRPDEPRHFVVIERVRGTAIARVGQTVVASSERALLLKEVGWRVYDPVIYFPPDDVRGVLLAPADDTTECPLKGTASYYDITGDVSVGRAAWSYKRVLDFDPRLTQLECCVAFDPRVVTIDVLTKE